ncbi:MAG: hypothetical protein UR60_C0019G0017 [Candidatus Moranbacteria bacterium GW2011_GWF2_34_56]|nr:MAG: hypothetical protein UR51_C0006G0022 [Candidatus Moranbacteria bacterium GW2011_GWF1_34_10]KKP64562.1 MAG: hypothetical protein UR60_C0019G0017 [Candidatus Moranbacteria bacterium GW2011_GWF2_34_56]HBI16665.1 hypothetical protein [Candidatus Moranbacteria bacterium]
MTERNLIHFPKETAEAIEFMLERFKEVIEENIKPWGRMRVLRDVNFRYNGEIVKFLAGIVDISPNPNFGQPPCEIQKPLVLIHFREEQFFIMIKNTLYRDNIPDLLTGIAKEIRNLTGYDYSIQGMRY